MVKVVLCHRCTKKLMWKKEREKKDTQEAGEHEHEVQVQSQAEAEQDSHPTRSRSRKGENRERSHKSVRKGHNSRSTSPRRHPEYRRIVVQSESE